MSIDELEKLDELEKKYKDVIFNKIRQSILENSAVIRKIELDSEWLGQSRVGKIYNSSTTLNNKLVELSHVFEKAGTSMFITRSEKYDFYGISFLGNAIIHDLFDKLETSIDKLTEYSKTMEEVSKQINERFLALQNISPIRKIFLQIRAFFVPVQLVDLSLTEEEQRLLNSSLQEYKDADSEIYNYNLEDNLLQASVKEIQAPKMIYEADDVPGFLEKAVIPDLKKLGLEHLIPQLQEAFAEEYKKNLTDSKINDEDLYAPDFSQKSKELNGQPADKTQGGLSKENFKAVDLSTSALNRDDAYSNRANQEKSDESIEEEII